MKKPAVFGKYILLERIGFGGMAEVFRARAWSAEADGRLVAVKRILARVAEDKDFVRQFLEEARRASQLSHANIAQIVDLGAADGAYYLALDHIHGRDVRGIFERCRQLGDVMPVAQACFLAMKVCEGLDYAHNKRDPSGRELVVLHRDVSPQNILVSFEGEVKLIDFGIAKALGASVGGAPRGKLGYLSPEQLRNDPGAPIDRRSDVFSCGVVLYELLTGERLFPGDTDRAAQAKVRAAEILAPSTYNRKIPGELERIVLKALASTPAARYPSALDLHDELQAFVYTAGEFYSRKDLGGWMKRAFAKELDDEAARLEGFRQLVLPVPPARPSTSPPPAGEPPAVSPAVRAATASQLPRTRTQPIAVLKHTPPPVLGPRTPPMPFIAAPTPTSPQSALPVPQPALTVIGHAAGAAPKPRPAGGPGDSAPVARLDPSVIGWEDDDVETQIYADQDAGLKHLPVLPKAPPRSNPLLQPAGALEVSLAGAEPARAQRVTERPAGAPDAADASLGGPEPARTQRVTQRPAEPPEAVPGGPDPAWPQRPSGVLGGAEPGRTQRVTQRPDGAPEASLGGTEPGRTQRVTQRPAGALEAGGVEPGRTQRVTQRPVGAPEASLGGAEPGRTQRVTQRPEVRDTTVDARAESPPAVRDTTPDARAELAPAVRDTKPDAHADLAPAVRDTRPDTWTVMRPEALVDARPEIRPDARREARSEGLAEARREARPEMREGRRESRPDVLADGRPEVLAEARREARSEALADARREARPEAQEGAPRDARPDRRREVRGDGRREVFPGTSSVPAPATGWERPAPTAFPAGSTALASPQAPPPRFDLHDGSDVVPSRTPSPTPGPGHREMSAASRLVSAATPVTQPVLDPMASFGARIVGARGARADRRTVLLLAITSATVAACLVIAIIVLFGKPTAPPPPVAPPAAKPVLADPSTGFDLYVAPAGLMHWKLDGEARTDRLPSRIRGIAAGAHTVEIEPPPGFSSHLQHIDVELGKAPRVEIKLQPISVVGSFETTPPGATVSLIVDGKRQPIGPSPAKTSLDSRSAYQVLFEKQGYVAVNRSITFTGLAEEHVAVKLDKVSDKPASPPR